MSLFDKFKIGLGKVQMGYLPALKIYFPKKKLMKMSLQNLRN